MRELASAKLAAALGTHEKHARAEAVSRVFDDVWARPGSRRTHKKGAVRAAFEEVENAEVRRLIVERGLRVDGRKVTEIRPISIEMAYLPRAHGSSLFTRGETQALVAATLGTKSDEQKIEALEGESYRHFLLHYNFPSFSVGEVRRFGSPSRRDIGHGALAERAVEARAARQGRVPLHDPRRLRHPRVQRLVVHGHRVRRLPGADGRRRADQDATWRASPWGW